MIAFDPRRRADLDARIGRARACVVYAEAGAAVCVKQAAALRNLALVKGIGSGRAAKVSKAAEFLEGTVAVHAEAARVSAAKALEALLAMKAELDEPTCEVKT